MNKEQQKTDRLKKMVQDINNLGLLKVIESDCVFRCQSHVSKLFNYWEPIAEKTVNGVVYRIAEGLIDWEERRKTYLLYKNENLFATFATVQGAKNYVDKL